MKFILFVNCLIVSIFYSHADSEGPITFPSTEEPPTNVNSMPLTMGGASVQQIIPGHVDYVENLHWNGKNLVFVDRKTAEGYQWNLNGSLAMWKHNKNIDGEELAFIVRVEDTEHFLMGSDTHLRLITMHPDGSFDVKKISNIGNLTGYKINKAHADNHGRLLITVITKNENNGGGYLYSFEKGTCKLVEKYEKDVGDLALSPDNSKMYLVVGGVKIVSYDYDINKGNISNEEQAYDLTTSEVDQGFCISGLVHDNNDHIWATVKKGGYVIRINTKTKKVVSKVNMPSHQLTSITFGGPKMNGLLVGTSKGCTKTDILKAGVYFISGIFGHGVPDKGVQMTDMAQKIPA